MKQLSTLALATVFVAPACGSGEMGGGGGGGSDEELTYYEDVKPLVDENCVFCHQQGGIGPFALTTYDEVAGAGALVASAVESGLMPPWPPAAGCNDYQHNRSLPQEDIDTIVSWVDQGKVAGDPADAPPEGSQQADSGLEDVDLTLEMAQEYTPSKAPDDYRCFVMEWPEDAGRYVTAYDILPGNRNIVHHVIAFLAPGSAKAEYEQLEASEEGPGYTCFGATRGTVDGTLGSWVPGSLGEVYPEGTGIEINPGDLVVLQVHYNVLEADPAPDLTSVELKTADQVDKEGYMLPWANPEWPSGDNMLIPAGEEDVVHRFNLDPTPFLGTLTGGAIAEGSAIDLHSATLHMHYLGESGYLSVDRQVGGEQCLLDIPEWDFDWQGFYAFQEPERLDPGDRLYMECRWDNTAANQPVVDGEKLEPRDVVWGEGTTDEMCLGGLYITRAD